MRKLLHWLSILVAGLAILWSIAALILISNGLRERVEPADVAVILGNEVYLNGEPSPQLKARLDRAIELFRQHLYPQMVVSGAIETNGTDESLAMRQYLINQGIPANAILLDPRGFDTMNTAEDTAALMNQHGWRRVMVISQYFHLPRCQLAFRKAGIEHVLVSYPRFFSWRDLWAITRELVAYPVYWFETPAELTRQHARVTSHEEIGRS